MLAIIILTIVAVFMLVVGFFDIRLPYISNSNPLSKSRKFEKGADESIEALYRTLRAERWLSKIRNEKSDLSGSELNHPAMAEFI